jgi:hypothetical protein
MAPQEPPDSQKQALKRAVLLNGIKSILRAGGDITATGRLGGGQIPPVKLYNSNKKLFHYNLIPTAILLLLAGSKDC